MYDPNAVEYWNAENLDAELDRVYDICHQCRMCFNLCPSFPSLFQAADAHEDEIEGMTKQEHRDVVDLCWQCKLCYVKCPYVPPHDWMIDFPRLLLRAKAQRVAEEGVPLRDRVMADPETLGRIGNATWPISNWMNELKAHRWFMDKVLGVHPDKTLPQFADESFQEWFNRRGRGLQEEELSAAEDKSDAEIPEVALFWTCYGNHNEPEIPKAAFRILRRNGVVVHAPAQRCCGMPALDSGDVEAAQALARQNVSSLIKEVRAGRKVVALNPTCSYMLKKDYPELLQSEDAKELAANTFDLFEFLAGLLRKGQLNLDFESGMGAISYHLPCHLQAQNMGYKTRDVLAKLPKTRVILNDKCTAHDGSWAMKTENFEASLKWGKKSFKAVEEANPKLVVSDCPLAALQIEQGTGRKVYHPAIVLDAAYRGLKLESPMIKGKRYLPIVN